MADIGNYESRGDAEITASDGEMTGRQWVYALFLIAIPFLSRTDTWIGECLSGFSRFVLR